MLNTTAITSTPKSKKPTARTRKKLRDLPPVPFTITGLSHDGRGVATYGDDASHNPDKQGKKVFVNFALPNEQVLASLTNSRKTFEEADCINVLANPASSRQTPPCTHFGMCGGCSLQHLHPAAQIEFKQQMLAELLQHQAGTQPLQWLPPIVGTKTDYRTKARLGVRYVAKKEKALVGFRERASNFLADIDSCHILDSRLGQQLTALKALIYQLEGREHIAQLEIAMGDARLDAKSVAVIVRHLQPLTEADINLLTEFFAQHQWQLYLQPKGYDSVHRLDEPSGKMRLHYQLPSFNLKFAFSPLDFTQVNVSVNQQMTKLACDLLELKTGEKVLDLFCGLGNFSLPLAKLVGKTGLVVGVEGSEDMVERAKTNATANGLVNTKFYAQDLTQDFSATAWAKQGFDALLIDPPRSGAAEVMGYLPKFKAKRLVYVSCNPATLARDTALLLQAGYVLTHAGVMDMFTHTAHVESIARFELPA